MTALFSILAADPLEHVLPQELFRLHLPALHGLLKSDYLSVTNQMFMAAVAAALMLLIFPVVFHKAQADAPHGARNLLESILEFLRVEVFRPALKEKTERFLPFLWTLFFFILFCNLLGQIPLGDIIALATHGRIAHAGGTATGTLSITAALAICAFLCIHFQGTYQVFSDLIHGTYGHPHHEEHSCNGKPGHEAAQDLEHMRAEALAADVPNQFKAVTHPTKHYADDEHVLHGQGDTGAHGHGANPLVAMILAVPLYIWNFAPHPFKPQPGESSLLWIPDIFMWLMLLILEMIGAVVKPFALSIRLFANMIAGHIVLAVLVGLIPITAGIAVQIAIGIPLTMMSLLIWVLELFVAFLQAYIFTFLTTLFIASAVAPEH